MPYTEEGPGLDWINNVNMTSFGSLVTNFCWAFGSVLFTIAAVVLLLTPDGPSLDHGVPTDHNQHRQLGFLLAGAMLGAWGIKTGAGVHDANLKRKANPEYAKVLEAEQRGKVTGTAQALALVRESKLPNGASAQADALRQKKKTTTETAITEEKDETILPEAAP